MDDIANRPRYFTVLRERLVIIIIIIIIIIIMKVSQF